MPSMLHQVRKRKRQQVMGIIQPRLELLSKVNSTIQTLLADSGYGPAIRSYCKACIFLPLHRLDYKDTGPALLDATEEGRGMVLAHDIELYVGLQPAGLVVEFIQPHSGFCNTPSSMGRYIAGVKKGKKIPYFVAEDKLWQVVQRAIESFTDPIALGEFLLNNPFVQQEYWKL